MPRCTETVLEACSGLTLRAGFTFIYILSPVCKYILSKQEKQILCSISFLGRVFGRLQLALAVTELLSTVLFTSIYPLTLNWYSGLCFLLSCAISYLSIIPIL